MGPKRLKRSATNLPQRLPSTRPSALAFKARDKFTRPELNYGAPHPSESSTSDLFSGVDSNITDDQLSSGGTVLAPVGAPTNSTEAAVEAAEEEAEEEAAFLGGDPEAVVAAFLDSEAVPAPVGAPTDSMEAVAEAALLCGEETGDMIPASDSKSELLLTEEHRIQEQRRINDFWTDEFNSMLASRQPQTQNKKGDNAGYAAGSETGTVVENDLLSSLPSVS
jgi:hypothetical protein